MRKWLALVLVALAGAAEAQPVSGGLLGRGASYSSFVPPSGCASGYVPYFDASLKLVCSPTVYAPATNTTTLGTLAAKNVVVTALPVSGSITVTPTGTTGSTTYTYSLQACLADGTCNAAGAASTTTAGNATLSATDFNRLSWSAVAGAAAYKIRRDVGGATQGVIWSGTALTVDDTGLAGDSSAKPTVDGTGTVTAGTVTAGRALAGDGTAAAPSLSFANDAGTGLYRNAASTIGFSAGGAVVATLTGFPQFAVNANTGRLAIGASADVILTRGAAAILQLGAAASPTPVAQTLQAQGGSGTDIAGAPLTLRPGAGTGSATGAALIIQTPTATGSGATAQTQTERARFSESGFKLASGTRPTCDASTRGTIFYVAGGAGVADTCEVCRKDAADAYAWVSLF